MAGVKGRSGAPKGNVNGVKTGKNLTRYRLTIGDLPKPLISVRREGRAYRRMLESATQEAKRGISLTDSHLIDSASAATIAGGICRWLLRQKLSSMTTADVLSCVAMIIKAKKDRDAAVKALRLDRDKFAEAVEALYKPADNGAMAEPEPQAKGGEVT
jgi:hypothetical protein